MSTIRISGFASGMDIDQIVKDLMKVERMKVDKLEQQKTLLEWKRDAYREINTYLQEFDDLLLNMKLSSTYRARSVTSSHENLVTATASNGAGQGSYTISNITQLAKAATFVNAGSVSKDPGKVSLTEGLYMIRDSFAAGASSFDWREGSVESQTLVVKDGAELKISLSEGVRIQDLDHLSIKANGKRYEVVTEGMPESGQVYVNTETGQLIFSDTLATNSTIQIDYVADQRIENRTLSHDLASFTLRGAIVEGSVQMEVSLADGTALQLSDNGNGQILSGETVVATIDYTSGKVTFHQEFLEEKLGPKPDEDSENEDLPAMDIKVSYKQHYFAFDIQTSTSKGEVKETFLVQGSENLNSVMRRVNQSGAGVMLFYDEQTDRFSLTRTETGDFNADARDIRVYGGFLTDVLRFDSDQNYEEGQNAKFTINGLSTERTSNTFTVNGVTFTLKNTTTESITVNVANDGEKLFETIKNFVDKYNEIVGKIEEKLNETKYSAYGPLTDLQREQLTEKQQDQWEEKAKSGLLRNDDILSGLLTQMRTALYSKVNQSGLNPKMTSLSSIGITTTSNFRSAKLQIDESKLRKAINEDPESVELLFRGTGTTSGDQGVIHRLDSIFNTRLQQLKDRAGNSTMAYNQYALGRQLKDLEDRIDQYEDRLKMLEDRYYRQFTAMEEAIQKANSQLAYLAQFFSNGSNNY